MNHGSRRQTRQDLHESRLTCLSRSHSPLAVVPSSILERTASAVGTAGCLTALLRDEVRRRGGRRRCTTLRSSKRAPSTGSNGGADQQEGWQAALPELVFLNTSGVPSAEVYGAGATAAARHNRRLRCARAYICARQLAPAAWGRVLWASSRIMTPAAPGLPTAA